MSEWNFRNLSDLMSHILVTCRGCPDCGKNVIKYLKEIEQILIRIYGEPLPSDYRNVYKSDTVETWKPRSKID